MAIFSLEFSLLLLVITISIDRCRIFLVLWDWLLQEHCRISPCGFLTVAHITYTVLVETLNRAQSINQPMWFSGRVAWEATGPG